MNPRVAATRVRFGDFVLDQGTRQLLRGDDPLSLGPKAFALLDLLLSQRPNVVPRERIRDRLWPGVFISESTLATVVAELRSALGDDLKRPRFLRTVYGVGYAFSGEAADTGPRPATGADTISYSVLLEDREIALHPGENLLGRLAEGVVWIESSAVSRRHARICIEGGQAILEDLASKNGTFLGARRISAPTPLADGDVFRIGRVSLRLRAVPAGAATQTDVD